MIRRRFRVLHPPPPRSFFKDVEARARHAAESLTPTTALEQRVVLQRLSLALDALDRSRAVDQAQHDNLFRVEQYVKRELVLLERRTPRHDPHQFPEREKLQRRLADVEKERRTNLRDTHQREHERHVELLELLTQHETLLPPDSWKPSSGNSGRSSRKR